MSEMSSFEANSFSFLDASYVFPNDLFITEAWPTVFLAFFKELFNCTSARSNKERLSSDRIVIGKLSFGP